MKNLFNTLVLGITLFGASAQANSIKDLESVFYTSIGVATTAGTGAVFYPIPASLTIVAFTLVDRYIMPLNYEGLSSDAIEVLGGAIELEESPALSLFKEDLFNNQMAVEGVFEEHGLEVDLEQISDEKLAELALATTQKRNL
ncbi:MAG: hypothetical protein CME67_03980 [Halobacteriovoraceae bacterium]|nr:hypothetical protein [Peredibacter sp.]MBJ00369.1 hypothetical protein [Halobacteriovoraceae bacterium]|tara:strand:+ start:3826 stop:4254 length:429 start_codon:yes stop_codon:yes gene_type:complete